MTVQLPLPADHDMTAVVSVASYPTYTDAQRAMDYLSDHGFPVHRAAIIGTDLRLVETVLGRLTVARAAVAGAGTGAWLGLLVGTLLALFTFTAWWLPISVSTVAGAAWGATIGAVGHAATRGHRDFASRRQLAAGAYAITAPAADEEHARRLLMQHTWRHG